MNFNELKRGLDDRALERLKIYFAAHRVHHSETYREIMHSVEKLADASFRLFAEKSKDEQTEILARMDELAKKINEAVENEPSLVVALTLLTALRVHEQLVNGYPPESSAA